MTASSKPRAIFIGASFEARIIANLRTLIYEFVRDLKLRYTLGRFEELKKHGETSLRRGDPGVRDGACRQHRTSRFDGTAEGITAGGGTPARSSTGRSNTATWSPAGGT